MEDDNGLELSLGLSFGGSSGKLKSKDALLDPNAEEGSRSRNGNARGSEVSLRNFLQSGEENHTGDGKQKVQPSKREQENFWLDLGKPSGSAVDGASNSHENLPQLARHQELWASSSKLVAEEEKTGLLKHKLPVEVGFSSAAKNSRVLATAEDGSTGENEDVADSEAECSNSLSVSQHDGNAKSTEMPKYSEKHRLDGRYSVGAQVQRETSSSANKSKHELGKAAHGVPMPLQLTNIMPVPYSMPVKATATNTSNLIGFPPPPCVMQLMPLAEQTSPMVHQAIDANNVQLAFGYSPIQLPTLETNPSWAFASRPRHVSPSDRMDGVPNTGHSNDVEPPHASDQAPRALSPALENQLKSSDIAKGNAKPATDNGESSSYQADREGNGGGRTALNSKESGKIAEVSSREGSIIRPGLASGLKFGGSGSRPDLPWVSTTGPDGKTISGVTYKYDQAQIRIVCACHGTHMSPEEFVQHASADTPNPEGSARVVRSRELFESGV